MNEKSTSRLALLVVPLLLGVFVLAPALVPTPATSAPRSPLQDIPVTGTVVGGAGTFQGALDIVSFEANEAGDGILATGLLNGTIRTPGGNQTVTNFLVTDLPVTLASAAGSVAAPPRTCGILDLSLGPLDLDLLGLVIHLDEVNLTIDAQRGPGNLLGNLLCAIVHLLDGNPLGDVLGQIVGLLNRIIDLLG
jgi:hypothetical protein